MEYVGGKSLKQILQATRGQPVSRCRCRVALAYAIEVLPALGYLHSRGLVYCDFKPDNVIQSEEQLKLIDMGGVRRIDDDDSPIYGTVGYQAPEIADRRAEPVLRPLHRRPHAGRADLRLHGLPERVTRTACPDPATVPVLAEHESFYRLLRRATDPDPDAPFASAGEMADQLTGVLREVLAVADGEQRPAFSTLFSPELQAIGAGGRRPSDSADPARPDRRPAAPRSSPGCPVPQVDTADPAAGYLATLSTLDPAQRTAALIAAVTRGSRSPAEVADVGRRRGSRWPAPHGRPATWTAPAPRWPTGRDRPRGLAGDLVPRGCAQLAAGNAAPRPGPRSTPSTTSCPASSRPSSRSPSRPRRPGDRLAAARYYQLVWTVDRSYVSAAFGLARLRLAAGDQAGAVAALATVPETVQPHLRPRSPPCAPRLARPRPRRWARAGRPAGRRQPARPARPWTTRRQQQLTPRC